MKILLSKIVFIIWLTGCNVKDYESQPIESPSKLYFIKATVNRTSRNSSNYADVIIHVYNKDKIETAEINSNAGDANKWTLGWTKAGDTIVLQSSDIGNKAWKSDNNDWIEINMTEYLNSRAEELKRMKYH